MKLFAVTLMDRITGRTTTVELYAENPTQAEAFGQNAFAAAREETFDHKLHIVANVLEVRSVR